MINELKNPGHTYFRYANDSLFGAVEANVQLAACNFPIFRKDASLLETAKAGTEGFKSAMDKTAIALTVKSEIGGIKMGSTIILTEEEQDNLILGILERRGHDKISGILDKITNLVPSAGIDANSGIKSKICPPESTNLAGEQDELTEEQVRESLDSILRKLVQSKGYRREGISLAELLASL